MALEAAPSGRKDAPLECRHIMSIGITKLFEDAEKLMDQNRFVPAVEMLEAARNMTQYPDRRAYATYNLGVIQWHMLGNGIEARKEFLEAIHLLDACAGRDLPKIFSTLLENSLENAMLCSLSYEEFKAFAARLQKMNPSAPIITGLVPEVAGAEERGAPWLDNMLRIAASYYNRNDPKMDVGRYGEAKSTYHLLLAHRKELRLRHDEWHLSAYEYCVLAIRLTVDCIAARGGDHDKNPPEDYLCMLTDAVPFAGEYLEAYPGDENILNLRKIMEDIIRDCRMHWKTRRS